MSMVPLENLNNKKDGWTLTRKTKNLLCAGTSGTVKLNSKETEYSPASVVTDVQFP